MAKKLENNPLRNDPHRSALQLTTRRINTTPPQNAPSFYKNAKLQQTSTHSVFYRVTWHTVLQNFARTVSKLRAPDRRNRRPALHTDGLHQRRRVLREVVGWLLAFFL